MGSKFPPVPPGNRRDKKDDGETESLAKEEKESLLKKPRKGGEQENIEQNTTNQGYQQNR